MAACAQCGTALPRGATACPECGTVVPRKAPAKKAAAAPATKPAAKAASKAPAKAATRPASRPAAGPAKRAAATAVVDAPVETPAEVEPPAEPDEAPRSASRAGTDDAYTTAPVPWGRTAGAFGGDDAGEEQPAAPRVPAGLALWRRVARGDWRAAAVTASLALAAALVFSALGAATAFVAPEPGEEPLIGEATVAQWLRYTCATLGMAFGSSLSVDPKQEDNFFGILSMGWGVAFAPLTVTLLTLGAMWLVVRRTMRVTDRTADVLRTAAVFAVMVTVVTLFGRFDVGDPDDAIRLTVSPWKALLWAFVALAVLAWVATGPRTVPERWREWALASRAAALGVGTGILWGIGLLVAFAYDTPGETVDVPAGEVTRGITTAIPYGTNLGAATFGSLTSLHIRLPSTEERGFWPLWSEEIPGPYLVALLAPLVAVLVATAYLRGRVPGADLPRVAARTAAPAALLWLAIAVAGTARVWVPVGLGFTARAGIGPTTSHAVLIALWFGVGGWLAGKALARR